MGGVFVLGDGLKRPREEWHGRNKGNAYMRWYSGDALSDGFMTSLAPIEENCYRRLMDYNFRDGSIPNEPDRLARLCKLTPEEFIPIWAILSPKFKPLNGKNLLLSNPRVKFEIDRTKKRSLSAKMCGSKGGRPPKSKNQKQINENQMESNRLSKIKLLGVDPDPDPDPEKEKEEEKRGAKAPPALVRWEPPGLVWKKDHPTLKGAWLFVEANLRDEIERSFPRVDVPVETLKMGQHAKANPSWARAKKDWRKTLVNWLKRADEKYDDARFRSQPHRSMDQGLTEQSLEHAAKLAEDIAACEKKHGKHKRENLKAGSRAGLFFCRHGCGFAIYPSEGER